MGEEGTWEDRGGRFTVGTALEIDALLEAGVEEADAFIAATDGDNTNLVISQIASRRFKVGRVIVRVMDPYRAAWYAEQGLETISPTAHAITRPHVHRHHGGKQTTRDRRRCPGSHNTARFEGGRQLGHLRANRGDGRRWNLRSGPPRFTAAGGK